MSKTTMLALGIVLLQTVQAQKNDTTTTQFLRDVVVTANKFSQKQNTTGKVISVIDQSTIEKSGGRTLAQLLNDQAGITINGALNNAGTNQTVFMRGASAGRTLILIDGIPAYDPSLINNEFDLNLLSLSDIERIEVCRGAQSTLYGSDAAGGVINIITTPQAKGKLLQMKTTLTGGNFGTFRGSTQLFGNNEKWSYVVKYSRNQTNGFSAAFDSTAKNDFERDGFVGNVFSGSATYRFSNAFSIRTFAQHNEYRTDIDAGIFSDESDFTLKSKNRLAGFSLNYQQDKTQLTFNYQYNDIKRNFLNDSLHRPGFTRFSTDDYDGIARFIELFGSFQLAKGVRLLQGADFRHSSMNSRFFSISSFGPFTSQFKDTSLSQASAYASIFLNDKKEKLFLEMGGRLNVHSRYGDNTTFTINPSARLSDKWRVFGSIASAFKAPSLFQLYSSNGNRNLLPETSVTYEVGTQFASKTFNQRLVYFNRRVENGIDFNFITFRYFNFLEQTVQGLEWEGKWQPSKGLQIQGNYTYLHARETTQSRTTFKDTTYSHVLRRPAHHVNLQISYTKDDRWHVSLNAKYVSSRFDVGGFRRDDVQLNGYFLLNAYGEYVFSPKLKWFADVQNVLQTEFFDIRGFNSQPRLIQTGIRVQL
jgi:vitamin B12 transporter